MYKVPSVERAIAELEVLKEVWGKKSPNAISN